MGEGLPDFEIQQRGNEMTLKKAAGNMYEWVTHTHSHLAGECPHKCPYCYVQRNRFGVPARYKGEPRLIDAELSINYGSGNTIFIEHMSDLFAHEIPDRIIAEVLRHCNRYPDNTYVIQTKNPERIVHTQGTGLLPKKLIIGTTIETNRKTSYLGKAPYPYDRARGMYDLKMQGFKTFVTIEPIMNFDVVILPDLIKGIKPDFVNIGADSKGCKLPEPPAEKILILIDELKNAGIEIRQKTNLKRILG